MSHQTILVLDFGSQYTQLIARRLRELSVYSEIVPFNTPVETLRAKNPVGIILSGGPKSVSEQGAPKCDVTLFDLDTPVLGIPTVAGASVAVEVLNHKRGPKVIAFKKRRRKNSRRKRGYRDEITVLRITEILTDNKKPSIGPRPKKEKAAAPAA